MTSETEHALNAVFDMPAPEPASPEVALVTATPTVLVPVTEESLTDAEQQALEDFTFSRGALKSVAVEVQSTLHRAVEVAEQTDTPRAFEAVGDLVRATLEAHRELQQLHKTAAEIRMTNKTSTTPAASVNIDKGIVFNGSPDELLKLIDPSRQ